MKASLFFVSLIAVLAGCSGPGRPVSPTRGEWRGVLSIEPDLTASGIKKEIPFHFDLSKKDSAWKIIVKNAAERITADEVRFSGDSLFFNMPVFDSEFRCRLINDSTLQGLWINHSRSDRNRIPFRANYKRRSRFENPASPAINVSGRWKVTFNPGRENAYDAIGEFRQESGKVSGTFLTETGDYRYLEGIVSGITLTLSCFDGSNAYLFTATAKPDNSLTGEFFSGAHGYEPWIATRNEIYQLRDPEKLTYLKNAGKKFNFSFPDANGNAISLSDEKFRNKVIIVQLLGTWCPNCMDETKLLNGLYRKYNSQGLEIAGICFEKTADPVKIKNNLERLKTKLQVEYPLLIGTGLTKQGAEAAFPMLNGIMGFPTTVFIDKTGNVRKIHTGFSGPGTGVHYEKQVQEITATIEEMLKE